MTRGAPFVLFLVCVLTGLAASAYALRATFVRERHLERLIAVDPWWIRAALAAGIVALLVAAWRRRRPARDGDPWVPLRLFFELLVLGSISYAAFLQPFNKDTLDVGLGLTAGFWGTAVAVGSVGGPRFRRAVSVLEIAAFNVCLIVVLAEAGLRLASRWSSSPLLERTLDRPSTMIRKKRDDLRPGRMRFGFPLNAGSYYDTEFPTSGRERSVAMVGDSFSFGIVPHRFHFSTVAERKMKAEVYNFGFPGIGPAEYLHLVETEVKPLAPAVIAVNVFIGNDAGDAKVRDFRYPGLRAWFDPDNLLVYQFPRRLRRLQKERGMRRGSEPIGELAGEDGERRLETVEELLEAYPWLADPALEEPTLLPETYFEIEKSRAEKVCDPSRKRFGALFPFIRDLRRAAGETPFVVQLIPDEFQVDDGLWRRIEQSSKIPALARDQPQEVIGDWLDREGIPHLDLLGTLRERCAAASRGKSRCYHLRDTHFNRRGNQVAGQAMADFLGRHLP